MQRFVLFLSSYSPVFVLLALQPEWPTWWWLTCLLSLLAAIGLGGLTLMIWLTRRKPRSLPVKVLVVRDAGSESAAFLATYLLPLITASIQNAYTAWATAVYLGLACIITIRSSLIQVNPILMVAGYRILQAEFVDSSATSSTRGHGYLLARRSVRTGDIIKLQRVGGGVYLVDGWAPTDLGDGTS